MNRGTNTRRNKAVARGGVLLTNEQMAEAAKRKADGEYVADIANIFGIGETTMRAYFSCYHKHGELTRELLRENTKAFKPRFSAKLTREIIDILINKEMSLNNLAAKHKCDRQTIRYYTVALKVYGTLSKSTINKAKELIAKKDRPFLDYLKMSKEQLEDGEPSSITDLWNTLLYRKAA